MVHLRERGVAKQGGGKGWAAVWKKGFFGLDYKGEKTSSCPFGGLESTFGVIAEAQVKPIWERSVY
jgi:hypothetical protein